jgi:acetylornithine/succinyldiaminopimelate/putrescine aminotransferase
MEKAFHGRTIATLSATGSRKVQAGFEPLLSGFVRVPYNDLETLEQVGAHNKHIVAILVEPIQGEGGINVPTTAIWHDCARFATAMAGCSCSTKCRAASGVPASGLRTSCSASSPMS